MANINNETSVVDQVVQPRFYQVYGDLIESKEVMEPLAIVGATGPICGFDWLDISSDNISISSLYKAPQSVARDTILGRSKRVYLSDKNNVAGRVLNAYITPDGLCHVAPESIVFENSRPDGGWPSLSNPSNVKIFVVKARHIYQPSNSELPPNITNFSYQFIPDNVINSLGSLSNLINYNYEQVLSWLNTGGVVIGKDTEIIVGIYIVGWKSSWNSAEDTKIKSLVSKLNYKLCLVPVGGKFPVYPFGLNPMSIISLAYDLDNLNQNLTQKIEELDKKFSPFLGMLPTKAEVVTDTDTQLLFKAGTVYIIKNSGDGNSHNLIYNPKSSDNALKLGESCWLMPDLRESTQQDFQLQGTFITYGKMLNEDTSLTTGNRWKAYRLTCLYYDSSNIQNNMYLNEVFVSKTR